MQPADGRGWLIRKTSLLRTAKTWPDTPRAASEARKTTIGAIFCGVICLSLATRILSASVSVGIDETMRLQAKGAMQLERTLKRCRSIAIERDRPTMPSLAAM